MSAPDVFERRAERRAKYDADRKARMALDYELLEAVETQYGYANVACVKLAYLDEDTPCVAAVRTPKEPEVKRYRARVSDREKDPTAASKAAEEIGESCCVYPTEAALARLFAAFPALKGQLGQVALKLSLGEAEAEGKD